MYNKIVNTLDFCLIWNWEYDADFVAMLDAACRSRWRSLLQVTPDNLATVLGCLECGDLGFQVLYDRACDTDPRFLPVVEWGRAHAARAVNQHEHARRSWDKATMHLEFITAGLQTPYTIILAPLEESPVPASIDLSPLGEMFIIKPAHGGGGDGVITEATSIGQVEAAQQEHPTDKTLVQAYVTPARLEGRPAWFRSIYCLGRVYPCWWDTDTHVYKSVVPAELERLGLAPLVSVTATIARVSGLELFSTEIARVEDGNFIVIDYVNEQLDLRLQSRASDGVPDWIVRDITNRLAAYPGG